VGTQGVAALAAAANGFDASTITAFANGSGNGTGTGHASGPPLAPAPNPAHAEEPVRTVAD
jgi:hypothetical protein